MPVAVLYNPVAVSMTPVRRRRRLALDRNCVPGAAWEEGRVHGAESDETRELCEMVPSDTYINSIIIIIIILISIMWSDCILSYLRYLAVVYRTAKIMEKWARHYCFIILPFFRSFRRMIIIASQLRLLADYQLRYAPVEIQPPTQKIK